jgi:microcystin-dependent protein
MSISSSATGLRAGVCTSTTRPANPYIGQLIFETDTFVLMFWTGSAWQGAVSAPAGTINSFAGTTAPSGWLLCAGQTVSRSTYANLFAVVGTTYGAGDGSTTFALPDLRGRTVAGKDDMGGSTASRLTAGGSGITGTTLGANGGTETHTLTTAQMPSHTHTQDSHNHTQNAHNHGITDPGHSHLFTPKWQGFSGTTVNLDINGYANDYGLNGFIGSNTTGISINNATPTNNATTATNQNTGGGGAHQNTQPTIVLNYIIKI